MLESRIPREYALAALWAVVLSTFILGPTIYATVVPAPGLRFTGYFGIYPADGHSYLAWVEQGREGWWLFANRYTTEPALRCIFNPVFLAVGQFLRVTGLPLAPVWTTVRFAASVAAVLAVYCFVRRSVRSPRQAAVALVLTTLASGLGWLVDPFAPFQSPDIWMPELTLYQSLRWPVLWAVSLAVMVGYFATAVVAFTSGSRRAALVAGALFALVAFLHTYDVVTFAAVPGVFLALEAVRARRLDWTAVTNYFLMVLVATPAVLTQLAVSQLDPVLRWSTRVAMASPAPYWYAIGFGPVLLVLAVLGGRRAWRGTAFERFVVVWAVAGALLLYAPVAFNRRLVLGLIIPLGILASYPVERVLAALLDRRPTGQATARPTLAAVVGLALLLATLVPTNFAGTYGEWQQVFSPAGRPGFVPEGLAEAFDALRTAPPGVVLASYDTSTYVPALAGQTAYVGHWAQTLNSQAKLVEVGAFFRGELSKGEANRLLINGRVRYLVFGPFEHRIAAAWFDPKAFGPTVFGNDLVTIVEVRSRGSGIRSGRVP